MWIRAGYLEGRRQCHASFVRHMSMIHMKRRRRRHHIWDMYTVSVHEYDATVRLIHDDNSKAPYNHHVKDLKVYETSSNDLNGERFFYKADEKGSKWLVCANDDKSRTCEHSSHRESNIGKKLIKDITSIFLPNGYPESVEKGYGKFVTFQFLASSCSSVLMVLSTQNLLMAVGLTTGEALGLSATLNWVLKDGIGQFGGIIFASLLGKCQEFDSSPKKWRMISGLALDAACMVELASPLLPTGSFLFCASLANVGKNVSFFSASASRAALHKSIARKENLADITAMAVSQGIVASLLGTSIGCLISPYVISHDYIALGISALSLSFTHQIATYLSLKEVPVKTLNLERLHLVLKNISFNEHLVNQNILSPMEVSKVEGILFGSEDDGWLHIGSSLTEFCRDPLLFNHIYQSRGDDEKYIINISRSNDKQRHSRVSVSFFLDATGIDIVRGIFHCYRIKKELVTGDLSPDSTRKISLEMEKIFPILMIKLNMLGWKVDAENILVNVGKRVYVFDQAGTPS